MWGIVVLGIGVVVFIIFLIVDSENIKEQLNADKINAKNMSAEIANLRNGGVVFRSHNNNCAAILYEDQKKLIIINANEKSLTNIYHYKHRVLEFEDIIKSEVVVDNETITSTSRGSQLAGGAVGGLALGGVGVVVGGLSGKTKSEEQIKNIDIKITLDNLTDPVCKINFLNNICPITYEPILKGFKKESTEYRHAISEVEKWQGMFDVILHNQN